MKARILDEQVKVYTIMEADAVSFSTLTEGTEIDFAPAKRKAGKLWVPITLSTGQQAFIPGEARIAIIRVGAVMQKNVDLLADPEEGALVISHLTRNSRFDILKVMEGKKWVKIRDSNGTEGYISGNTRIREIKQKTKALARKNILSGAMWLVAGGLIVYSSIFGSSGGSFTILGYGALLYGVIMLVSGLVQFFTAPS
jgi:SH3-like domain-containing protein